jgi:hypothetical protein
MLPPNFCGHRLAFLSRPLGQNALRGEDCYRKVRFNPLIPYSRPMNSCGHYRVLTDEQCRQPLLVRAICVRQHQIGLAGWDIPSDKRQTTKSDRQIRAAQKL